MSYWTTTKTALALVSIGILVTPVLRRLGYLPPDHDQALPDSAAAADAPVTSNGAAGAPPELSLPRNGSDGSDGSSFPRH